MMRRAWAGLGLVTWVLGAAVLPVNAQENGLDNGGVPPEARRTSDPVRTAAPSMAAVALADGVELEIDGVPTEAFWLQGSLADEFVQFEPEEGVPATERTEVRVVYGPDALYVAFWAFDSDPSAVVGQLSRRDQGNYTDRVHVVVDSYFDRRTAFHFAVNPLGVKYDAYWFDDTREDSSWDAVWDGAAQISELGWTAEFRIPYSQLRFSNNPDQTWGIQFVRDVARKSEKSLWAPMTREEQGTVSRFGRLEGIEGIDSPRRLELLPYTLGRSTSQPGLVENPFYEETANEAQFGGDMKYGITGNLTLDVTVNPDFGQVEADPAQLNLSQFEVFQSERRPFFLEGANIYNFNLGMGDGSSESLFYSRRIGRAPQGWVGSDVRFADRPGLTTIAGAGKVSGKTESGWSIGTLYALTQREQAEVFTRDGEFDQRVVEPLSNYVVARVQKDFREGRTAFGFIGTGTQRDREDADLLVLRSGAYSGGFDFRHRFGNDRFEVSGYVVGTHVRGSEEAIARTQLSSARYFQRPDADHVEFDPTRTSLTGWSGQWFLGKISGGNWRFATGGQARSPGFEANDLGFMTSADYVTPWVWGQYTKPRGSTHFNRYNANVNVWSSFNFAGENTGLGGNVNGNVQFKNFWNAYAGIGRQTEALSTQLLRGGPGFLVEPNLNGWMGFSTDSRKRFNFGLNLNGGMRSESDSWRANVSPNVTWRPSGRATFRMGAFYSKNMEDRQWVRRVQGSGSGGSYYTFGRMDQQTVGLTGRIDFSFTPDISLQLYVNPFVSAGDYEEYKVVDDPRGGTYDDRLAHLQYERDRDGTVRADVDGDGEAESLGNPDFNFQQFNSNVVLRWEYRPGSALFLVWQQARDYFDQTGEFSLMDNAQNIFDQRSTNIFMVKVSYWFSP